MDKPYFPDVHVRLKGRPWAPESVIGRVGRALRRAGVSEARISEFRATCYAGNLLETVLDWVVTDDPSHPGWGTSE